MAKLLLDIALNRQMREGLKQHLVFYSRQKKSICLSTCEHSSGWCVKGDIRQDGRRIASDEEDWFLADVRNDPHEIVNLARDPAHRATVELLRKKILDHVRDATEPDFVPAFSDDEAPEVNPPRISNRPKPA